MSNSNVSIRSIQELELRYVRFCAKHDLDASVSAEEQYAETETQQRWLDKHVESLGQARAHGVLLARGRTDVVRDIARDLNDRLDVATGINLKKSVAKVVANTKMAIEIVVDYSTKPSSRIKVCPSPLVFKNAKQLKGGAVQLGLPMEF